VKYVVSNPKPMRKGTLIGFFDLEMPSGLIVRGVMLFEKNDRRWCSFPSKEFTKQDGSKGYSPLLEWTSKEVGYEWQDEVTPLANRAFDL
jgi:hypothetical protein